jgi:hypothetical protein
MSDTIQIDHETRDSDLLSRTSGPKSIVRYLISPQSLPVRIRRPSFERGRCYTDVEFTKTRIFAAGAPTCSGHSRTGSALAVRIASMTKGTSTTMLLTLIGRLDADIGAHYDPTPP